MALTRLDNLYSSKTGRYLYVSPDDFNATDELDNRGNSPLRPFKTIQRAFIEVARYSYLPGRNNDRFDQFSIMLMPGNHYIDNRPGIVDLNDVPEFNYNQALEEWNDDSILDLSNPDNVLYKFNAATGGAIVPRGCSLIGYDLRRTIVRPLYVPDPADGTQARTSIFNLTGGCYLWQFTIKDGDLSANSPLFDETNNVGKVYFQKGNTVNLAIPEYSHHKITIMTYADSDDLTNYYTKIAKAFAKFQPSIDNAGEFDALVQENRIVGPLSDTRRIDSIQVFDSAPAGTLTLRVTTKIDHGYFVDQYIAILNTGLDEAINGTVKVTAIDNNNPRIFEYEINATTAALGLISGQIYTAASGLSTNAVSQAEIDSVESASPYVFNCSIRSTWGMCGMWADGAKATGFKSMVVAQYTGVSLQKDDRAFIRYDRFTNTWNQASLTDAFATVPYHTKGDAYWKDDWRNFHIRASDDSFIQCVSVFAVGFFDHFLMESGGDMSITNSNSNFGNTSLHAIGFKGFSFNQDKGGYITDIIPPRTINSSPSNEEKIQYYTLDVQASNPQNNHTRLYIGSDDATDPADRPAATIKGYRIGARSGEKIYVKLDDGTYNCTIEPNGFVSYKASLETLNPAGIQINNIAQDAANRIEDNKTLIQNETYNYIIAKYPYLLTRQSITIAKCERDIGYFVDAVVQDLRLGGNVNTIQAAEGYYVGGSLAYINSELDETVEALDYVKNMCIAAMRNFDVLITDCETESGSAIVNVGDTTGLLVGMAVAEYNPSAFVNNKLISGISPITSNIPTNTYIKRILDDQRIELGESSSKLTVGNTINAQQSSSTAYLYFDYQFGAWSSLQPTKDDSLIQDTNYPECADIATTISQYFSDIFIIINQGLIPNKIEPIIDFTGLSKRATLFTINTGESTSNPHQFETGTPVRLIPKAKPNTNPDKKVIRLPKGFSTNTKYYVIAPGRFTQPEDYSGTTYFDGSDQTKLMLAATKENAAAGIFIYSPETDSVDPDVEIEVQKYILDDNYDLHKYRCNIAGSGEIETDVAHIFDLPNNSVTPQLVFFRIANDILGSDLPEIAETGTINTQKYYYARFISPKKFSIHPTYADAIAGVNAVSFVPNSGQNFYVFANKRISPLRFEAAPRDQDGLLLNTTGLWYLQVKDETSSNLNIQSILYRFKDISAYGPGSGKIKTLDTWFTRLQDTRKKEDRVYRLRYVIPKYLETVRDPLNGFVIKVRTDDKRRLVPQKFVLKPIGGAPSIARFDNPEQTGERIGYTKIELLENYGIANPSYDPYLAPKVIGSERTQSRIAFTIQSAKKIEDESLEYLEITAFDHAITNEGLKNEIFSVVKVNFPQGGTFTVNNVGAGLSNLVTWDGFSSGSGYIQGYFEENNNYYLVIKNITGQIKYSSIVSTRFTQGAVFADLLAKANSIGDPNGKDKSDRRDYLYRIEGANVYTLVPGDIITDDANNQYKIENVRDAGNLEDSFYIFDIDTIQERIAGQQDGIYYLTCLRGNISPFPTGAGVGANFRNFKFSQPISQLYPQNYKNDPTWFKQINSVYNDPPASISAADNYIHGLVTINDAKNSETKELVQDLILQPALTDFTFVKGESLTSATLNPVGGSNIIEAQEGNATSGSEDRYISISGNSDYPTERKLYVELRRPSIARSGNHTFEYLGFGPGNYSTGFPLRQEVVLTDAQDFYAQSKKEDGGIVFYTGLNSNGDLYIGNRKINAITGEETYLERAVLEESQDDGGDDLGGLVTTFDTPVTFNDRITVEGNSSFNNPVQISVAANEGTPLRIFSVVNADLGDDVSLGRAQFPQSNDGDITLGKNRINAAVYGITPRQVLGLSGQGYSIRTHYVNGIGPSNITPNQKGTFGPLQIISYSNTQNPKSGDILLKGSEVGRTGSLGWVYANYYTEIVNTNIQTITSDGTKLRINWAFGITNADVNVIAGSQLRITNFSANSNLNGIWTVLSNNFNPNGISCEIQIAVTPSNQTSYTWSTVISAKMEVARVNWKEFGVFGSESIRTETDTIGNYKVGINTVARSSHSSYANGFVSSETTPRANLDVVGTAFISGKLINNYLNESGTTKTETVQNNAFLVGGNSLNPDNFATFRISTANNGRVGINISNTNLDKTLVVGGDSRFTGDSSFASNLTVNLDLAVNGGDITTSITSGTFNLLNNSEFIGTLNIANNSNIINVANKATTLTIANDTTETQTINVGGDSYNSTINIGTTPDNNQNALTVSKIEIGGAYNNNESQSYTRIKTKSLKIDGDIQIGSRRTISDQVRLSTTAGIVNFFSDSGSASSINFGLNASSVNIAGQGGTTKINNKLEVVASAKFNSNIHMSGGSASFVFVGTRGQLGTTISSHTDGILGNEIFDKNVDIVNVFVLNSTQEGYNEVDTSGSGPWGGTVWQQSNQYLPTSLTGNEYYLPLLNSPILSNGDPYFVENDYIIVNSVISGTTIHPEIVQVVELTRANTSPYYIKVKRVPFGSFTPILSTHPDRTSIYKVNIQFDSTWIEQALDGSGTQDNVYLSEFGGVLTENDYVIISRKDTNNDGVFDSGEIIKVAQTLERENQIFKISDGTTDDLNVFTVDSITGDTFIKGKLQIESSITINGGCKTINRGTITGNLIPVSNDVYTYYIENINSVDINKVQINDIITLESFGITATVYDDTRVVEIDSNKIKLSKPINILAAINNVSFQVSKNEEILVTNGHNQNSLYFDTCTSSLEIGNQFRRLDISRVYPSTETVSQTVNRYFSNPKNIRVYSYWKDPMTINDGGSNTTLIATASTGAIAGSVYLQVTSLGVNTGAFAVDDLVLVGSTTDIQNNGKTGNNWEIMKIASIDINGKVLRCLPGQEGTSARNLNNYVATTTSVVRILKHKLTASLIDIQLRSRTVNAVQTQFVSIIIDNGQIAQTKFDYPNFLRFEDLIGDNSNQFFFINGGLRGKYHEPIMNEIIQDGTVTHRTGNLILNKDLAMYGGNLTILDSVSQTTIFRVVNDDGHADHSGSIYFDAGIIGRGDIKLYPSICPENITSDTCDVSFSVDVFSNAEIGNSLIIRGTALENPSKEAKLKLDNLGVNGANQFVINQDQSIDAFGITNFYTKTGGRHIRYVSSGSDEDTRYLKANITYFANVTDQDNLVLYLPENPISGDCVTIVEVGGNLTYDTSLVIRALGIGTRVQGDNQGTTIGIGGSIPYNSGELVVQTPNAAFTLIYLGGTDSEGNIVSSAVTGWWLKEV